MNLSAPKQITFWIALALAAIGVIMKLIFNTQTGRHESFDDRQTSGVKRVLLVRAMQACSDRQMDCQTIGTVL